MNKISSSSASRDLSFEVEGGQAAAAAAAAALPEDVCCSPKDPVSGRGQESGLEPDCQTKKKCKRTVRGGECGEPPVDDARGEFLAKN
jgi:hypothetical protein